MAAWAAVLLVLSLFLSPEVWGRQERLRVSTLFIGSSLLPIWVAQERGLFSRAGVDIELIWMQSVLSTSALLAGEVDVIFGREDFETLPSWNGPITLSLPRLSLFEKRLSKPNAMPSRPSW